MGHPVVVLLVTSFVLGSIPLIEWVAYGLTGKQLSQLGTKNVGVSAAFYHGGTLVGTLAVFIEIFRGVAVVLLARSLFPQSPFWEILALIPIVLGRYWVHRGAGVTNVVCGYIVHDWRIAFFVAVIGGIGFTLIREKAKSRWLILMLVPLVTMLVHPYAVGELTASIVLCLILAAIYHHIPDDLELSSDAVNPESKKMFDFFRGDRSFPSLDHPLNPETVGQKAATLAQLKQWGYPVPMGWVIRPGDDSEGLVQALQFSIDHPFIVRSTAIGEDSECSSAAGQYESIPNITTPCALRQAIVQCQQSYTRTAAKVYRRDRHLPDTAMAVLVQQQIKGVFSGVAFSRDPITRQGDAVVIEALPGNASQVVSGRLTPERYRVFIPTDGTEFLAHDNQRAKWRIPEDQSFPVETVGMDGDGNIPPRLIQHVAYLVRHIEDRNHGIPQDMEWSYDGHSLWVLQSRPITTLLPIWTRKIAAEVIPGYIRPLTWSINQPLTCGVWGDIFSVVLGDGADQFDFGQTATLHYSVAYFNASLLGQIFRQMGLPAESLEFLTRGAKFKRPPLDSTLKQIPGLWRLLQQEWAVVKDFERDRHHHFDPGLTDLSTQSLQSLDTLTDAELGDRIDQILALLQRATYYNILAPLSLALRQGILKPNLTLLDQTQLPEVASLQAIQSLVAQIYLLLPPLAQEHAPGQGQEKGHYEPLDWEQVVNHLQQSPDGIAVLEQVDQLLDTYGYLSEVATDIAVPRWRDDPRPVHGLLVQSLNAVVSGASPVSSPLANSKTKRGKTWKEKAVQRRVDLKGQVAQIYNQLLAELRWTTLALEQRWLTLNRLQQPDDIFFLTIDEIRAAIDQKPDVSDSMLDPRVGSADRDRSDGDWGDRIHQRRSQWQQDQLHDASPYLVYGNDPVQTTVVVPRSVHERQHYQGIGASPGQVMGPIVVMKTLQSHPILEPGTILVVPYTDAGWAPLLTQASGIITEVGGCLSHGAIIAREYGIPAVMNVANSTQVFRDGQVVHLDGATGRIAVLRDELNTTR